MECQGGSISWGAMGTGGWSSLFLPRHSRAARNCSKTKAHREFWGRNPSMLQLRRAETSRLKAWHTSMETDVLRGQRHQGSECFIQVTQQCFQPVVYSQPKQQFRGGAEGWKARNAHLPDKVATGEGRLPLPTLEERRHRGRLPKNGYMPRAWLERGAGPSEGSWEKLVTGTNQ